MNIDKTRMKDSKGRYIVQGIFLEDRYNTDLAVFTYDGEHKTYKDVLYPSLKKLYLEHADPLEYDFANTYLFDWPHWQRSTSGIVEFLVLFETNIPGQGKRIIGATGPIICKISLTLVRDMYSNVLYLNLYILPQKKNDITKTS